MDIANEFFAVLGAILLMFSPGLLVVLALPTDTLLPRMVLLAAFILSPAVVALELAVASYFGVAFSSFVSAAAAGNAIAAAAFLAIARPTIRLRIPIAWVALAAVIIVPFAIIIFGEPYRREYSFHNMMQLAAFESIYQLPRPPEELTLAGTRLNYGWLGWAQLAVMSKLLDRAPTLLYIPINIAQFIALFVVLCEAVAATYEKSSHATQMAIGLAVGTIMLSPALGGLTFLVSDLGFPRLQADGRVTPSFSKHVNMDLMAFGLSSFALMVYAAVRGAQTRHLGAALLLPIATLSTGIVYPLLVVPCVVLGGLFVIVALLAPSFPPCDFAHYSKAECTVLGIVGIACLVPVAAYVTYLGHDTTKGIVQIRLRGLPSKGLGGLATFILLNALLLFVMVNAWRLRLAVPLLFAASTAVLQVMYTTVELPVYVEYKFLYGALLLATPVTAAAVLAWSSPHGRLGNTALVSTFAILLASTLALLPIKQQMRIETADALDEHHARIQSTESSSAWLLAVRQHTPADTMLLSGPTEKPLAIFAARALYVCADRETNEGVERTVLRVGYALRCETELVVVKGYSKDEIRRRTLVLSIVLNESIDDALALETLATLSRLDRPLAIHTSRESGFLKWLKERGIGREIFASRTDAVWLVDRVELMKVDARADRTRS